MPLVQTRGAASAQGFGEFAQAATTVPQYIEDVFSTYLYTGTSASQTITNGIDLSTKGGMIWLKSRSDVYDNYIVDTVRGFSGSSTRYVITNSTAAQSTDSILVSPASTGFLTNGFTLADNTPTNFSGYTYASWTFREQPKFFDVVTWTGNGANRTIAHNLGSVPGCIIVKRTDTTADWAVYHRSLANTEYLVLNTTAAKATGATWWNSTTPTSAVFSLGTETSVNASGGTYVAYIFAHDAGGFGLAGTDNVISCGSYTGNGSANGPTVTLGYEPQWMLVKNITEAGDWYLVDVMRGWTALTSGNNINYLNSNTSNSENPDGAFAVRSTGFKMTVSTAAYNNSGSDYIYIAIRRGPMKVPTSGTSVFGLSARTGTGANATVTGGQTDDAVLVKNRGSAVASLFSSRLTGTRYLVTSSNAAEVAAGVNILQANPWDVMDGVKVGTTSTITNSSGSTYINYLFKRAPSFFDVVCYVGAGSATTVTHNLGVTPELFIVKDRTSGGASARWAVYTATAGAGVYLNLNNTVALQTDTTTWNNTSPTASVFSVGTDSMTNSSGNNFISYLFATLAGVSKVGSYTGTATTLQIDCGFTSGARFVLIKRTDSTGDWYVWDTARGIVAGNDRYFLLNTTAAEVTNTDYIDTYSAGFEISSTAPAAINASGGTFIFLAIA
jgi:hypothetical protein